MSRMRLVIARLAAVMVVGALASAGCATKQPRTTTPSPPAKTPPASRALESVVGLASYYGAKFHGRRTASGLRFDMHEPVAAHPTYPFGTRVRVTNLSNARQIVVTIIDRGPARRHQKAGVVIDLAQEAARVLGFIRKGRQRVRVDVLEWGDGRTFH